MKYIMKQLLQRTTLTLGAVALALWAGVQPVGAQLTNLGIALAGNQTVLFWPAAATNYVLQWATNLAAPNWVTVSNATCRRSSMV